MVLRVYILFAGGGRGGRGFARRRLRQIRGGIRQCFNEVEVLIKVFAKVRLCWLVGSDVLIVCRDISRGCRCCMWGKCWFVFRRKDLGGWETWLCEREGGGGGGEWNNNNMAKATSFSRDKKGGGGEGKKATTTFFARFLSPFFSLLFSSSSRARAFQEDGRKEGRGKVEN